MTKMTMSLFLLTFMGFLNFANSEMKMMLVWGEPTSKQYTIINDTLTWEECIKTCYLKPDCLMAWQSNDSCLIYKYSAIGSVMQTSSENGSVVAFKVNSPDDQCPIGENAPTFNNQNATGYIYVNNWPQDWPLYLNYTIYLDNNEWKVSYNLNRSCLSSHYNIIERLDGSGLCVMPGLNQDTGSFSYDQGVELCKKAKTFLAGLVYPEDFAWYEEEGQYLRTMTKYRDIYARIDGVRTAACRKTPKTAQCMSPKGFTFTGPPVPHFDNYKWVTNPSAMATPDDNCLVMVFQGNNTVKVDVKACSYKTSPLKTQMIFCTTPAWKYSLTYSS